MADPLGSIKKAASDLKTRYDVGTKETEGLGKELSARSQMNRLGEQALKSGASGAASAVTGASKPSAPSPKDKINPTAKYGSKPGEQRIDVSGMTKPLGSMKKGGKVNKTGMYQLHAGEEVVPAESKAGALGSKKSAKSKKGSGKKPHKMVIEHMDDQSFGITHQHKPSEPMGQTPPDEKFTAPNPKALTRHVRATYSDGSEEDGQ